MTGLALPGAARGYLLCWLPAFAAIALLSAAGEPALAGYFGPLGPTAGAAICGGAGIAALWWLTHIGWLASAARPGTRAWLLIVLAATAFALPTIFVDSRAPFPADVNVTLPSALLFYPAIAVIAESAFHLVPLALLTGIGQMLPRKGRRAWAGVAVIAVAMVEPAFQIGLGDGGPAWRDVYLGLHLFLFGLVQLALLRRYGFGAMLGFRLVYYLHWHLLWGQLRLVLLF